MSESADRPAQRSSRRIARRLILLAVLFVFGWYVVTRAASPWTALRVVRNERAAALSSPTTSTMIPAGVLRVGCYNIAHGRGSGDENWNGESRAVRAQRLDDIARFLADADLDVVVLNEVDFDSSWSGGVNQAAVIAARAGYPYRVEQRNFDVAVPFFSWKFGNAILSRHPISDARMVDLPGDAAWETVLAGKKTAAVCTIELPAGENVRILAVHLSYRSEDVRVASVRGILAEAQRSEVPIIVAGDFNSMPASFPGADPSGLSAMDDLLSEQDWTTSPTARPGPIDFTYSSTEPRMVIDWIVAPSPWQVLSRQVYPVEFSDHRPVVAILRKTREDAPGQEPSGSSNAEAAMHR